MLIITTDVAGCCETSSLEAVCQGLKAHHKILDEGSVLLGQA